MSVSKQTSNQSGTHDQVLTTAPEVRRWEGRAFLGMSLDGFIADTQGSVRWLEELPHQRELAPANTFPALEWETFFPRIDAIVMGRRTYDTVAGFDQWPFPGIPVLVLSRSHSNLPGNVQVIPSVVDAAQRLDDMGVRSVYVDGGQTVSAFLQAGLLQEITVAIAPIILGQGLRLFDEAVVGRHILTVTGQHLTQEGLVRITYRIGSSSAAGS